MNPVRLGGRVALAASLLVLVPSLAHAHSGAGAAAGFTHGFAHPLLGLDHLLAMIAVGILAAQRGGRALWVVPSTFVAVMFTGFLLGANGFAIAGVELGIAASLLVLGGAVARRATLPAITGLGMLAIFALFHGHAHGGEMTAGLGPGTWAVGFLSATLVLHGAGIVLALAARTRPVAPAALDRVLGGAIAAAGLLLLL